METVLGLAFAIFIIAFIAFDLVAVRWGADSRPSFEDDRPSSI